MTIKDAILIIDDEVQIRRSLKLLISNPTSPDRHRVKDRILCPKNKGKSEYVLAKSR